jgi:hypothetical protein
MLGAPLILFLDTCRHEAPLICFLSDFVFGYLQARGAVDLGLLTFELTSPEGGVLATCSQHISNTFATHPQHISNALATQASDIRAQFPLLYCTLLNFTLRYLPYHFPFLYCTLFYFRV